MAVAKALNAWLPLVFQSVAPFMSRDIDKGDRWQAAINDRLDGSDLGIICLTPENLESRWLLFEAGAISKKHGSRAWTYLYGLTNTDVQQPLAQFQHTQADQEDTGRLVESINATLAEDSLDALALGETFRAWWPKLKADLDAVPPVESGFDHRDEPGKIDEILTLVRELHREDAHERLNAPSWPIAEAIRLYESIIDIGEQLKVARADALSVGLSEIPFKDATHAQTALDRALVKIRDGDATGSQRELNSARALLAYLRNYTDSRHLELTQMARNSAIAAAETEADRMLAANPQIDEYRFLDELNRTMIEARRGVPQQILLEQIIRPRLAARLHQG